MEEIVSVRDFLDRYYKAERYIGRGAAYAKVLLANYENQFNQYSHVFISRHDSITGRRIEYRGAEKCF